MGEAIIDNILRHLPLFAGCTVIDGELFGIDGFLEAKGKEGPSGEKRGSSWVKAAFQILHRIPSKSVVSYHKSGHPKKPPCTGGSTRLTRSIHRLWQPRWPTVEGAILGGSPKHQRK